MGSYIFSCNKNECELGFANISRGDGSTNTEIKNKLEKQYGDNLFELTNEEEAEIDNLVDDYIDKTFR